MSRLLVVSGYKSRLLVAKAVTSMMSTLLFGPERKALKSVQIWLQSLEISALFYMFIIIYFVQYLV